MATNPIDHISQASEADSFYDDDFLNVPSTNLDDPNKSMATTLMDQTNYDSDDSFYNDDILESFVAEDKNEDKDDFLSRLMNHEKLTSPTPVQVDFSTANGKSLEIHSQTSIAYAKELALKWSQEKKKVIDEDFMEESDDDENGREINSPMLFSDYCGDVYEERDQENCDVSKKHAFMSGSNGSQPMEKRARLSDDPM